MWYLIIKLSINGTFSFILTSIQEIVVQRHLCYVLEYFKYYKWISYPLKNRCMYILFTKIQAFCQILLRHQFWYFLFLRTQRLCSKYVQKNVSFYHKNTPFTWSFKKAEYHGVVQWTIKYWKVFVIAKSWTSYLGCHLMSRWAKGRDNHFTFWTQWYK